MTSFASTFFFAISMSVRSLSARRTGGVDVDRLGTEVGAIDRIESRRSSSGRCVPPTISRLSASSAVRIVACAATRFCRAVAACDCAWTTSIGAIVPTSTRVWLSLHELIGQIDRLLRHVHRLHGEHVIPVRVADVRQRVRYRRAQLHVGDVAVDLGDGELLARRVDPEAAQQRLRVRDPTSWCCRSGCRAYSGWLSFAGCCSARRERAAAPRDALGDAAVVGVTRRPRRRRRRCVLPAMRGVRRRRRRLCRERRGQRRDDRPTECSRTRCR